MAKDAGKPVAVVDPFSPTAATQVRAFVDEWRPSVLNVAGSRESKRKGIEAAVSRCLFMAIGFEPFDLWDIGDTHDSSAG